MSNKREQKKNSIRMAIRKSLDNLVKSGIPITQVAVIKGAVRDDGSRIGATTLYSRRAGANEFVHADLLKEINTAVERQKKNAGKRTRPETIADLRDQLLELKNENTRLVDQIVTQQEKIRVITSDDSNEKHTLFSLEDDVYVLSRLVDDLSQGAVVEVKSAVRRYDDKYADSDRLELATQCVEMYRRELKDSRLVGLNSSKRPKKT